jgi:uncharacterized protein YfaS (alpha-2-macroglobulin family)
MAMREWPDGARQAGGSLAHNAEGKAAIEVPALPPGPYRLHYESTDDFGTACRTSRDFVVAGRSTPLALPAVLIAEKSSVPAGGTARFLVHSGLQDQPLYFELWRSGRLTDRRRITGGKNDSVIEIPVSNADRGGFGVRLTTLRDYQFLNLESSVFVPWDDKELKVEFSTFRDMLRPGNKETWRINVKSPSGANAEPGAAELLAYMYDRSLDALKPHIPPNPLSSYPNRTMIGSVHSILQAHHADYLFQDLAGSGPYLDLREDRLKFYEGYGIGGPGRRGRTYAMSIDAIVAEPAAAATPRAERAELLADAKQVIAERPPELRANFAETAFWEPHLITGPGGSAIIEFAVPDSVTSWNVWVHAITRDLRAGSLRREARSVKELMVRPYLPRFLREGDQAEIRVVVNNAANHALNGQVSFDIIDPETNQSVLESFGLQGSPQRPFSVAAGGGTNLVFPLRTPLQAGLVAFKVTASSEDLSDGELRPVPILPGRMHLAESRFVALKNKDRREMSFPGIKASDDPSRVHEQMVVTIDAQLFYSVLSALPYLVNYPYECTEQTLNRFVSSGILASLYNRHPAVARMAEEFSKRQTRLETWDAADPNRKLALEETPWLTEARGGQDAGHGMANVLDPRITKAERESALAKLRKAQTVIGGFPWWPGGPPSPYMTLYIMYGFAKAAEFQVDVPKDIVQRGWAYLAGHFRQEYADRMLKDDCSWEFLTFLNYAASCYPDESWMGNALTPQERKEILEHSFRHWKEHSPYLRSQLALTLKRMGRPADASLVFASVMDSARTTQDEGTFWAPEDRAWLWYNDTIETHAFALRTLMEIVPEDPRKDGLVQWLFLNKKFNQWKSTRATAEVIYSLVHYLQKEGAAAAREDARITAAGTSVQFVFEPDRYTGKKNQLVIPGDRIGADHSTVVVEKESAGLVFASATWHFSTEKLPEEGAGGLLSVSRKYFRRENTGREFVLKPLGEGSSLKPGDEVEVQLSVRAGQPCEYVHLRDPRAAGLEPGTAVSRYRWDLGLSWYEETRDSGTNFFFELLPQGEYTLRYRLRAATAGVFKASPATIQSMYAPEFAAYSSGAMVEIR